MVQRPRIARPLHVLVATPAGGAGQGGIDRIMHALQSELERQGDGGMEVRFAATRGAGHVALSPLYTLAFCIRMLVARLTGRLDVVHLNIASNGSTYRKMAIAAWAQALGVPYVLHLHGGHYDKFWRAEPTLLSRLIGTMFAHAAQIVVLGRIWRDVVASRAPAVIDRISIVPNATEVPRLAHVGGGEAVHILFLGRINAGKGVPQLGEALTRMLALPGWRATVAGDGDVEAARRFVAEHELGDRVDLPGWVGPDEVMRLIAESDVLVLPSFIENLPLSIIEGMASGLAVVATPVGAIEDIIVDEVSGLLVLPGDVDGLTAALSRLVRDPALRTRLGAAALATHRERLELGAFARAIGAIWESAGGSNGRRPRQLPPRHPLHETGAISNEH